MPDPRNETPPPEEGPDTHAASLEDLVAALGKPSGRDDETADDEHEEALEGLEDPASDQDAVDEVDPYAEYADLDLATSLPIDPDDDLSKLKGEASPRLMSIVESLLFAASKPMTVKDIRRLLKEPTKRQIQLALKQLILDTQHRGVVLGQVAGGFRLRTHPDNAAFVQKMLAGRPVRLSRSQLESLAVVAYRQPVTKAELDHIRGVDCGAVLRVLLERDLVKIVGRKEEAGRPHLYGTTIAFLEFFNLKALRDLPDLHEFRELNEESEATLKHSMTGSLAQEQEAMGQGKLDFDPEAEGDAGQAAAGDGAADAKASADVAADETEAGEGAGGAETSGEAGPGDESAGEETPSEAAEDVETSSAGVADDDDAADAAASSAGAAEDEPADVEVSSEAPPEEEPADEPAEEATSSEAAPEDATTERPVSGEAGPGEASGDVDTPDDDAPEPTEPPVPGEAVPGEAGPGEASGGVDTSSDDASAKEPAEAPAEQAGPPSEAAPADDMSAEDTPGPAGSDDETTGGDAEADGPIASDEIAVSEAQAEEAWAADAAEASARLDAQTGREHAEPEDENRRGPVAEEPVDASTTQDGEHAEPDNGDDS